MTTDFPTAPSAYGLNGPPAAVTVEKSPHASHTEILTTPDHQTNLSHKTPPKRPQEQRLTAIRESFDRSLAHYRQT